MMKSNEEEDSGNTEWSDLPLLTRNVFTWSSDCSIHKDQNCWFCSSLSPYSLTDKLKGVQTLGRLTISATDVGWHYRVRLWLKLG